VSVDLDSPLAQMQMDITDITFADNSFELIICNHVLEHIPDDAQAMRELFRVLKPGGLAILQVPISYAIDSTYEDFTIVDSEARLAAFGQRDHVRIYGPDYPQRLGRAGFAVKAHPVTEMFRDDEVDQFRLLINERLFECRKPEPS
jgi:SAM-dependent methyltransferase